MATLPNPSFYDDRVRECLKALAESSSPDPYENLMRLISDSNLDEALANGVAYGNPVDSYLRRIQRLVGTMDFRSSRPFVEHRGYRKCQALAVKALEAIADRPMGSTVGTALPQAGR